MTFEFMKAYVNAIKTNDCLFRNKQCVNGFVIEKVTITNYNSFCKIKEAWESDEVMPDDIFIERFLTEACYEWQRNDEYGKPYEGEYWSPPDGSDPVENASTLTELRNAKILCSLPYPHHFKLWLISNILCPTNNESVQLVNSYCALIADIFSRYASTDIRGTSTDIRGTQ